MDVDVGNRSVQRGRILWRRPSCPAIGGRWRVQSPPTASGATLNELRDVACPSATLCVAVGDHTSTSGVTLPLAERWNGSRWALLRVRRPRGAPVTRLFAVACRSATWCTTVGYYNKALGQVTLAERWNSTGWALPAHPQPQRPSQPGPRRLPIANRMHRARTVLPQPLRIGPARGTLLLTSRPILGHAQPGSGFRDLPGVARLARRRPHHQRDRRAHVPDHRFGDRRACTRAAPSATLPAQAARPCRPGSWPPPWRGEAMPQGCSCGPAGAPERTAPPRGDLLRREASAGG